MILFQIMILHKCHFKSRTQVLFVVQDTKNLKDYVQAEGVSVELGVALELTADLSHKKGVPEMAEYHEKVLCNSARPHVEFVPGGSGTGTCLTRADTCIEEHASGVWFSFTSVVRFTTFLDHLETNYNN